MQTSPQYQAGASIDSDKYDFAESGVEEHSVAVNEDRKLSWGKVIVAAASVSALLFLVKVSGSTNLMQSSGMKLDSIPSLEMSAFNEYGDTKAKKFAYPFLDNALFAEPYKTALFEVRNTMAGCDYSWSIAQVSSGDVIDSGVSDNGNFTSAAFETVGQYLLSVEESGCDDDSYARTLDMPVWVKYVRRELLTLTVEDREAFLDAFSTLWQVNTKDGISLYGPEYKSLYYFASIHNDAGANSACDEFHGDQGFINNHLMLGAYLEQSLQLVDPRVCLHYMEYATYFENASFTDHLSNQLDKGTWTPILTSTWFGSSDPISGRILDGRWENASVPYMNDQFYEDHGIDKDQLWFPADSTSWLANGGDIHVSSPYGLLRSPWNWNPNTFVTRYNAINGIEDISSVDSQITAYYVGVQCRDFEMFLTNRVVGKPLYNFLHYAEDQIHGQIHFTFGGAGGDYANEMNAYLASEYGLEDEHFLLISQGDQTFVKKNYPTYVETSYETKFENQNDGAEFPFSCTPFPWNETTQSLWTTDIPGEPNAICELNSDYYCQSQDTLEEFYALYLSAFQESTSVKYALESKLLNMDTDTQCEVAKILVKRAAYDGEMAGSGAALDPLFWVAHGAVERLLQKIIFENVSSDLIYDSTTATCSGHANDGTKYWLTGYSFEDTSVLAQNVTNVEMTEFMNPTTDHYRDYFNFVYDSSDYSFCSDSDAWFE